LSAERGLYASNPPAMVEGSKRRVHWRRLEAEVARAVIERMVGWSGVGGLSGRLQLEVVAVIEVVELEADQR